MRKSTHASTLELNWNGCDWTVSLHLWTSVALTYHLSHIVRRTRRLGSLAEAVSVAKTGHLRNPITSDGTRVRVGVMTVNDVYILVIDLSVNFEGLWMFSYTIRLNSTSLVSAIGQYWCMMKEIARVEFLTVHFVESSVQSTKARGRSDRDHIFVSSRSRKPSRHITTSRITRGIILFNPRPRPFIFFLHTHAFTWRQNHIL